jgi:hypothetical protein
LFTGGEQNCIGFAAQQALQQRQVIFTLTNLQAAAAAAAEKQYPVNSSHS